jgi:integrase
LARQINRLSARKVATITKTGRHADGGGLYLSISNNGGKRWVFLYRRNARLREMGLGGSNTVSLARARELASDARLALSRGLDPIGARLKTEGVMSFGECAKGYIEANKAGWRNAKHATQWQNTLDKYANPIIGSLPVDELAVGHITKVLEPIWITKTETASRVRGRIETVLDWAKARGYRAGENPARWRRQGIAAQALDFLILTTARTAEVIGVRRREIDTAAKLWTVPAGRIKGEIEHRVPLSPAALAVIKKMPREDDSPDSFVFSGDKSGQPLSNNALLALLERMGHSDITVHGFRSTFRDWAAECTNFPNEVAEMALAHVIKDETEAAYRRGDLLQKRRALMIAWAGYCDSVSRGANIVPMTKAK